MRITPFVPLWVDILRGIHAVMRNELLDVPSPVRTNLRLQPRPLQAGSSAPPVPRPLVRQQLKALRAAELEAWESASGRRVESAVSEVRPLAPRLPRAESSISLGEKVSYGILVIGALGALAVSFNDGMALVEQWEKFVGWVRTAVG